MPRREEMTRHYIALLKGCHAYAKVEDDDQPEWEPIQHPDVTYYQVSREVAEAWTDDPTYLPDKPFPRVAEPVTEHLNYISADCVIPGCECSTLPEIK